MDAERVTVEVKFGLKEWLWRRNSGKMSGNETVSAALTLCSCCEQGMNMSWWREAWYVNLSCSREGGLCMHTLYLSDDIWPQQRQQGSIKLLNKQFHIGYVIIVQCKAFQWFYVTCCTGTDSLLNRKQIIFKGVWIFVWTNCICLFWGAKRNLYKDSSANKCS